MSSLELHKIDFRKFMEAIDQCKGDVYIITEEGDKLNLKSQFCRLIGVAKLVEGGMIKSAKVVCENPEDDSLLFRFNLYGEKVLEKKNKE
ncbi:MAG: hypothetical protein DBX47_03875 [Clostridiales bacterium]|nr:MAG: hypothetical protein DBX47_03875 [Clostridiales bacterium]